MSSSVLVPEGYAKFRAWPSEINRALLLGFLLYCVKERIVGVNEAVQQPHKLFDFVVLAWTANLQRRGV